MTDAEFRELYAGALYAYRGDDFVAIVQLFRDGRVRFTDFLPGGVETGFVRIPGLSARAAAERIAAHNGLELREEP